MEYFYDNFELRLNFSCILFVTLLQNSNSMAYSLNLNGTLAVIEKPLVMGILNVTPDSFYDASRVGSDIVQRARAMLDAGAAILDVGACSTRPGAVHVSEGEELERMHAALALLDKELPGAVVSIDTYRGRVVRECVKEHNVAIINDVSGYEWDNTMLASIIDARLPYILTHSAEIPEEGGLLPSVLKWFSQKMWQLRAEGVHDIIIDPGFGFAKTLEQNYELMNGLGELSLLDAPLLAGVSRKSMITRLLGIDAAAALPGTTALIMVALSKGAAILRVHDVAEAAHAVKLWRALNGYFD